MSRFFLHNNLRDYRRAAGGLTQLELATMVGVSRQSIIAIERGRFQPGVGLAISLARALSCRVEDLFVLTVDHPPDDSLG